MKVCSKCSTEQPLARFQRHSTTKDGYRPECKSCGAEYSRDYRRANEEQTKATARRYKAAHAAHRREYDQAWAKANPDRVKIIQRRNALKSAYGITLEDYERMLAQQDGNCAVCLRPPGKRRLAVDHDHNSGMVRALLCDACNIGLGAFKEDPDVLGRAREYVEFYKPQDTGVVT